IDGDARDTGNGRSLVEEGAPHDTTLELGDDPVVARAGKPSLRRGQGRLGRGKVRREMMAIGDRLERLVADGSAPLGVGGGAATGPVPPPVTPRPLLKVISPASTQATSSLSRCRWNMLLVPTGTVSSNSMMLSLVSCPTSFRAAKRPGAPMSRCFPPPAGTTKP